MRLKKNNMANIKRIYAYEIIDSRGLPTIEGKMVLDNDREVATSIPAGTSIGKYEAVELRDSDPNRFDGMGVTQAVSYINDLIAPKLIGVSPLKQQEIDAWLVKADGTKNKSKLGANTTLTISQLSVKAAAADSGLPLFIYLNQLYEKIFKSKIKIERIPTIMFNAINGGRHANNNLDIQEFHLIPSSSFSYTKAYTIGVELFHELKKVLEHRNANISIGEEGGFAPNFPSNVDALEALTQAINQKKLKPGVDVFIGMDMAASYFYKGDRYVIRDKEHPLKTDEYLEFVNNLIKDYSILILEDPINQDDWESWKRLNQSLNREIYLVGDDLLTTNKDKLLRAIKEKACTSVMIKPNQIGTISETLEVINIAKNNNFNFVVGNRSGETNDSFIADLSVAVQADFVKFGGPTRGERVAKYNRLWQIEREELK